MFILLQSNDRFKQPLYAIISRTVLKKQIILGSVCPPNWDDHNFESSFTAVRQLCDWAGLAQV